MISYYIYFISEIYLAYLHFIKLIRSMFVMKYDNVRKEYLIKNI